MKERIRANHGLTLIEVLVTLTLISITSSVIYGVFITGMKLYQKIGIESQLRDDADYAVTMIMNEMYDNPPSYVTSDTAGIQLVRYQDKHVNNYVIDDLKKKKQDLFIYFENETLYLETHTYAENGIDYTINTEEISSATSKYITSGAESSSISFACGKYDSDKNCQHGIINLKLVIEDSKHGENNLLKTKPLTLKSSFGF